FSYDGQRVGQGRENAKQFLKSHPEIADAIERKIRESAGLLSEQLIGGAGEEAEAAAGEA
ncbi:MAG: DNA recombination/repair protein RecA, partial [Alphaproteobacteria bacterium]|nr:DNA recombination/repair protein RecA [Alphaproteobacteria bacterium]